MKFFWVYLCKMLTEQEEKFLLYWKKNKSKEKSIYRHIAAGMPIGLLIGAGIILNYVSGWYTRATMVANSQSTPLVLIFAVILIILFCSIFYRQHQWEMNEQRFLELTKKKELQNSLDLVQQVPENNSQIDS